MPMENMKRLKNTVLAKAGMSYFTP